MKKKGWKFYFSLFFIITGFIYIYFFGKSERELKALIDETGIEAVGTVVKKTALKNNKQPTYSYTIYFDYVDEGITILSRGFVTFNESEYANAMIGMKYKVKYLPDASGNKARIYIDQPIIEELYNIEKERKRIKEMYNYKVDDLYN